MKNLTFSFDIGYNSIGWCALEYDNSNADELNIAGTGVVLFESDSCLASKRRDFRRLRRTIRSRRKRIDRIGNIMETAGLISSADRKAAGHPAPFFLAARALQGKQKLSAHDVWQLMRWYAQNRGYDGNQQWARNSPDDVEDTKRVNAAKEQMTEFGTVTMAETICAILKLDTAAGQADLTINSPSYKKLNLAFPREVVVAEVQRLFRCSDVDDEVANLILEDAASQKEKLASCGVLLPKRFGGSILFGQLIPRFDNRIIARCPITWAHSYRRALAEGKSDRQARKEADKFAKVPKADSAEFYRYRFARILANIRVGENPLPAEIRRQLMELAEEKGKFTLKEFKKVVAELTGNAPNNLANYFGMNPEAEKALIVNPARANAQPASGRAPYARPVLRTVVEEILNGEDSTRPMRSLTHPDGETKAHDGVLYCMQNPESDEYRLQEARPLDTLTNNHMVRQRLLIFQRLLKDMIDEYAAGNEKYVKRCVIEVGRELKEYSGKSSKEIAKLENEKLKDFHQAIQHLEKCNEQRRLDKQRPLPINAKMIRKCRIAIDLDWRCPYTGQKYAEHNLEEMELEHIVPHAARQTNAMSALVLTWREVNQMKGRRTGIEFVRDFGTQSVPGRSNLSIMTEKHYIDFVKKLDIKKGAAADKARKKKRKRLMLIEHASTNGRNEELAFTEGQMTQSSQLMKLSAQMANRFLKHARTDYIPGYVTATTRKTWDMMSLLATSTPEIINPQTNKLYDKEKIRGITHMHHAVDACTLAVIPHLIPAGNNGMVWQALQKRSLNSDEAARIRQLIGNTSQLRLYQRARSTFGASVRSEQHQDAQTHFAPTWQLHLKDMSEQLKLSLSRALSQKRVVRHIPADMSGAKLKEQYVSKRNFCSSSGQISSTPTLCKELGLNAPMHSKLHAIKAVLPASDNYAAALLNPPVIIPHISVYKQIARLKQQYHVEYIPLLRRGQLINVTSSPKDNKEGIWRVQSVKNNTSGPSVDLQRPEAAISSGVTHPHNWINVRLRSLMKRGFTILKTRYTGSYQ